jgi:hypothetical protein
MRHCHVEHEPPHGSGNVGVLAITQQLDRLNEALLAPKSVSSFVDRGR